MNKILIVYEPESQRHLIARLMQEMQNKGMEIEAFCTSCWRFFKSSRDITFVYRLFRMIMVNKYWRSVFNRFFLKTLLLQVSREYDVIDIHYFSLNYISFLKSLKKPFKITIWGSDFYRMHSREINDKRDCLKKAFIIQCETNTVKKDLAAFEPSIEKKIRVCNFGIDLLDVIDDVNRTCTHSVAGKICLTCGYNGSEGQQHLKMIEALQSLPINMKQRLYVLFPMTYGLGKSYRSKILKSLEQVDFEYKLIEKRLSDEDLARLRVKTDIAVNIQVTDSLSSSLLEHLYAKNVLILGDWLPCEVYDDNEIFYIKTSLDKLRGTIEDCVDNVCDYQLRAVRNREIVRELSSWTEVSTKQFEIYKEIF